MLDKKDCNTTSLWRTPVKFFIFFFPVTFTCECLISHFGYLLYEFCLRSKTDQVRVMLCLTYVYMTYCALLKFSFPHPYQNIFLGSKCSSRQHNLPRKRSFRVSISDGNGRRSNILSAMSDLVLVGRHSEFLQTKC